MRRMIWIMMVMMMMMMMRRRVVRRRVMRRRVMITIIKNQYQVLTIIIALGVVINICIYIYCKSNTTISNAKIRRPANVNRCDTDGDSDDDDEYRADENDDVTMMLIVSSLTVMPTKGIRIPMFSIVLHCLLYPILSQVVPMQMCFQ